jgi:hypothetical protein
MLVGATLLGEDGSLGAHIEEDVLMYVPAAAEDDDGPHGRTLTLPALDRGSVASGARRVRERWRRGGGVGRAWAWLVVMAGCFLVDGLLGRFVPLSVCLSVIAGGWI